MDSTTFWTVIGLLVSACGAGFLYLAKQSADNRTKVEALKVDCSNKPTYKDVADDYVRKEVNELQFKAIEKDIKLVLDKLDEIKPKDVKNK